MSPQNQFVKKFLAAIRRQKNRHHFLNALIWATMIGAASMIGIGLCYVLRGYAVPGIWAALIISFAFAIAMAIWIVRRLNVEHTAKFTDRFFQLQDTVTSYLHFSSQGHQGGYYDLQAQQTADRVAELNADEVRYQPPKRLLSFAAGLLIVAIPISLLPNSDEVIEQQKIAKITQQQTSKINQDLEKEVEKLIEETKDKDEKKLLEPDKLRRWVKELKTMEDRTEALRQYAKLQRKIKKVQLALQRKKDEQLLKRAAKELKKDEKTKKLGKMFEQKKYKEAAKQIKELKPKKMKSKDKKKRDLARLRKVAQRLAHAARMGKAPAKSMKPTKSKGSGKSKPSKNHCKGDGSSGSCKASKSGSASGEAGEGKLSETIGALKDAMDGGEKSEGGEEMICELIDELIEELEDMERFKLIDIRLGELCRCCGQCQSDMACPCASPKPGGHRAGWGSNTARRDQQDELIDNGQTTQLKGTKGHGPSLTAVEAAEEGSGISNRRSGVKARNFKRTFESFVQREDVPEEVKDGVKKYFQIIHENEIK